MRKRAFSIWNEGVSETIGGLKNTTIHYIHIQNCQRTCFKNRGMIGTDIPPKEATHNYVQKDTQRYYLFIRVTQTKAIVTYHLILTMIADMTHGRQHVESLQSLCTDAREVKWHSH